MRVLWVFLVFFCFCFSSNAQMQDESTTSTSTSETEMQGDLEITTTTTTTTTIENKTTGDILDGDTGVVATRYEGDMDQDWGGIGSASMPNCPSQFSGGGRCAKGTSNSLTTFQQNISISQEEAEFMLMNDIERVEKEIKNFPIEHLNEARRAIIIDMAFNMGITRFNPTKWPKFFIAIANEDYGTASKEMLDSNWARQTKRRSKRLSDMMLLGDWIEE